MKHLFIPSIFCLILLGSCKKSYHCECRELGDDSVEASYTIKESSKSKAESKCKEYNTLEDNPTKGLSCTLK